MSHLLVREGAYGQKRQMVTAMDEFEKQYAPTRSQNNIIESLCQEFNGVSFYGLEYVIEDFFQPKRVKSTNLAYAAVDWFGLYD